MSPSAENLIRRLDGARHKWWIVSLLTTTVLAACASLAAIMGMVAADALFLFSQPLLLALFLAWLLLTGLLMFAVGRRVFVGQRSLEAAARRVEAEYPELGSSLINLVQLSEEDQAVSVAFREAAIRQATRQIGATAFDRAPTRESRRRRLLHCMQTPRDLAESIVVLAFLMIIASLCQSWIPNWGSAASRLLAPWKFTPSVGSVKIIGVSPGNAEVLIGQSVEIAAEIENPDGAPHRAALFVTPENEVESKLPMTASENGRRFRLTVPSILKPFCYRLEIGDSQTQVYTIGVREKPSVESMEATFHFPAYLGRADETIRQTALDLETPQYTVAELRLRTSTPVARGYVQLGGERLTGRVDEDGRQLSISMPLLKNGTYTVHLFNDAGHTDANPRQNRVSVFPDAPPKAELLKPARQSTAAPGAELEVLARAGDDHGLGLLRVEMKIARAESDEGDDGAIEIVKQWTDFARNATTGAVRRCVLSLKPEMVEPGQTVLLRAAAADRRLIDDWGLHLKPQETAGAWHAVKIIAKEEEQAAAIKQFDSLRAAILAILEKQIRARTGVEGVEGRGESAEGVASGQWPVASGSSQSRNLEIPKSPNPSSIPRPLAPSPSSNPQSPIPNPLIADIRSRQIDIQKTTADLARSIDPSDKKERLTIKRALNALAVGDMLEAVSQCDVLMKADGSVAELTAAQDRIIDALRRLLDAVRRAEAETLADVNKRPGGDLPDDTRQKLEDIRAKLDKFLEQQKKIIEAGENLAKTPVEDFSKEQEELLKGMAAAEDDWAKFMKDLHSDFSKLPEQDFANASMAKELVEIQTELKMAADALLKKSVDIAVPLEQLGYEMAEELKTNLEKWLPDSPDREKWSQEESLTDKDKEAPMAELPGELEDLIGELMEEEEDLFDEMEDVSSSAADSLDKGAGWDAMDGPISNMSAKGVTGNRLPNTSEIGGRSGEGRQGKSSGEFVGDEAVGKGGRKTPSRLTPDPVMKGQIKDHSKQSAGGATGGGKESGKGGEGLEGPVPRSPGPRDAERLAGKQAALRNKAESIDLQFQVNRFHRTDLEKMIEAMSQVERDLKAGRYQNALRQRQVLLEGLGNVKQYLEGEFEVRKDATTNLPADIQKDILGSMSDPSPPGWEDLNRRYFERLSSEEKE